MPSAPQPVYREDGARDVDRFSSRDVIEGQAAYHPIRPPQGVPSPVGFITDVAHVRDRRAQNAAGLRNRVRC